MPGESEEDAGPTPEVVDGIRFLEQGEGGEPLVLLHGFGGDLNNWLFNAEPLSVRSRGVRARPPRATAAASRRRATSSSRCARSSMARGSSEVHLAGHSMGGLVAGEFAAAEPERVLSLALIAPAGLGTEIDA